MRRQELEKRRPFLIGAAAGFILGLLAWTAYYAGAAHIIGHRAEEIQQKVDKLRATETALVKLRQRIVALDSLAAPLIAAINDRGFWPHIIEDLHARLPRKTSDHRTSGHLGRKPFALRDAHDSSGHAAFSCAARCLQDRCHPKRRLMVFWCAAFTCLTKTTEVVVDYFRNLVGSPWFAIEPNNQAKVISPRRRTTWNGLSL